MAIPLEERGAGEGRLLTDIQAMIGAARTHMARTVNGTLVMLYWGVGKRIRRDLLTHKRADYGRKVIVGLAGRLTQEHGRGFAAKSLFRMVQFAERFQERRIVATLSRQLGWSHIIELLPLKDPMARGFYTELCRIERWSVRTLRAQIASLRYERTALSRKPAELALVELDKVRAEGRLTPDMVFQDPYFLDFLDLKDAYREKDLETAILRQMESFVLELGVGFAFVERQKRLQIGDRDYYLDLLFYHRGLRRLVAVDLKLDRFRPEFKGQMELYLRWLERNERVSGERAPLGLILCSGESGEEVELLQLDKSGIRVAQYLTQLPPRRVLQEKLHEAIKTARDRLATRGQ